MILQKVTFKHLNRNATTIDDFYYRNIEDKLNGKKGTGVRLLSAEFIRQGKALDRFIILKDDGCTLETYMIFRSMEDLNEFIKHPVTQRASDVFIDKGWSKTVEIYPINDYLNVKDRLTDLPEVGRSY
jgi:hypothetical protein